jgi:hypothetical protein
VTASFGEDANCFALVESAPDLLIEIVVVQLKEELIRFVLVFEPFFALTVDLHFCVGDDFLDLEFVKSFNCDCTVDGQLREFSSFACEASFGIVSDDSRSFGRLDILGSLD